MARIIRAIRSWFSSYDASAVWNDWNTVKGHAMKRECSRRLRQLERGVIQKF